MNKIGDSYKSSEKMDVTKYLLLLAHRYDLWSYERISRNKVVCSIRWENRVQIDSILQGVTPNLIVEGVQALEVQLMLAGFSVSFEEWSGMTVEHKTPPYWRIAEVFAKRIYNFTRGSV